MCRTPVAHTAAPGCEIIVIMVVPVELEEADAMLVTSEVACIIAVVVESVLEVAGVVPILSSVINNLFKSKSEV